MQHPTSAYIHIPFCAAKCGYCDFNSYAGLMPLAQRYVDALCKQIASTDPGADSEKLHTVFFGGGTPSILQAQHLVTILDTIRQAFGFADGSEITMEANPESATLDKLQRTRDAGFNRVSMGAQSFTDETLISIGRVHTHDTFLAALKNARTAGYENISFDLMFGLPGQSLGDVQQMMKKAIDLGPDHISAYSLTIENSTDFHTLQASGALKLPDEDLQSDMFLLIRRMLTEAGFEHYEISNYAKPGFRCRHNETYWRNEPYWGFGTGAVEYLGGRRTKWESNPQLYIEQIENTGSPQATESEYIEGEQLIGETAMLGLRTSDGFNLQSASQRFGLDVHHLYRNQITKFTHAGLLRESGDRVCLTENGQLLANEVIAEFLV